MIPFDPLSCPTRGRLFIEASAGTGKTHGITSLVLRLLTEEELPPEKMLLVTYTNAATDELKRKLRERLNHALGWLTNRATAADPLIQALVAQERISPAKAETALRYALANFEQFAIHTIHGFCQRALGQLAFESAKLFDTEFVPDQRPLLEEAIFDFWRARLPSLSVAFHAYLAEKGKSVRGLIPLAEALNRLRGSAILPRPDVWSIRKVEEALATLIPQTRELLRGDRASIRAALRNSGINQSSYRSDHVANWLADVEEMLGAVYPLPFASDKLVRFTKESLRQASTPPERAPQHPFFDLCDQLYQQGQVMEQRLEEGWTQLKRDLLDYLKGSIPQRKAQRNCLGYDDLLDELHGAVAREEGGLAASLAETYQAILIDEFQDTDPIQYAIFNRIGQQDGHRLLCLIGDPKQAIYGFRGGDVYTYTFARGQADHVATLRENWRSTPRLIQALNAIFGQAPDPFLSQEIAFHPLYAPEAGGQLGQLHGLDDSPARLWAVTVEGKRKSDHLEACARATSGEIARLLAGGMAGDIRLDERGLRPSDIAVLVRSHYQADLIQRFLQEAGVRAVTYDRHHIFETEQAKAFDTLLLTLVAPRQESALKSLLLGEFFGLNHHQLYARITDEAAWSDTLERFQHYRGKWHRLGFVAMFREFLAAEGIPARLLGLSQGERRLTNTLHLAEMTEEAQVWLRLSPAATLSWFREQLRGQGSDEKELRLESDDDRVKILTVHRSKGLEFPIVFVPFAWAATGQVPNQEFVAFHAPREDAWHRFLDLGSAKIEEHRQRFQQEQAAEEMRLLYVALTRAQHRLYIPWAIATDYPKSSLARLLHQREASREQSSEELELSLGKMASHIAARADVLRLVGASEGTVSVSTWTGPRTRPAVANELAAPGVARRFHGRIDRSWQVTSYSALQSGEHAHEGPDHDLESRKSADQEARVEQPMLALPHGPDMGIILHEIYQHVDFSGPFQAALVLTRERLAAHGLDVESWAEVVARHLADLARTDLGGVRLGEVPRQRQLRELAFFFPLGPLSAGTLPRFFREQKLLADGPAFQVHAVTGFVKGFIDLVFEHQGRFHVVDYKSNYLGGQMESYRSSDLGPVMEEAGYVLQYHLYAVALHHYLRYRLGARYDYERHFGGVLYLFVRGIQPSAGADFGVFRARPEKQLVEELANLLAIGNA